ncbi:MAG: hypothetical protein SFX72_21370 [Isosphaeraceae bacterium]|nr:hypothetical protein [Isosphaeraceae bacterium]
MMTNQHHTPRPDRAGSRGSEEKAATPTITRRGAFALAGILGLTTARPGLARFEAPAFPIDRALAPLLDREGFAGMYAGVSRGALLAAGGANFPKGYPWEGGLKVWSDAIFVLQRPDAAAWVRLDLELPAPRGYGASFAIDERVLLIGGEIGSAPGVSRATSEVLALEWRSGKASIDRLPDLPEASMNHGAAVLGERIHVVGGISSPDATSAERRHWSFDPRAGVNSTPRLEPPLPGPGRMLAAVGRLGDALIVAGGVALEPGPDGNPVRRYLADCYSFRPGRGWRRVADLPRPLAAAPAPALERAGRLLLLGGDDGSQVARPPLEHAGFSRAVLAYGSAADRWVEVGTTALARVTAPVVEWGGAWVVVSGEAKPGRRSPEVRQLQ